MLLFHISSARHAVFIERELALHSTVIKRCRSCPSATVQGAEHGDPLPIQLVLNIERALDVVHIHALLHRAHDLADVLIEALNFTLHLIKQLLLLRKLAEGFDSKSISPCQLTVDFEDEVVELLISLLVESGLKSVTTF